MAKLRREEVVSAALELLDEVGLDGLSTRRLAQKLGVESASLYWHFRDKSALLGEMASLVLSRHQPPAIPDDTAAWPNWFADLARKFRVALLSHRDGALLHAGTTPNHDETAAIVPMIDYLVRAGFTEADAHMALLVVGQYTVGCVLEQQARPIRSASHSDRAAQVGAKAGDSENDACSIAPPLDADGAFEFGLDLIVSGLRNRQPRDGKKRR